MDAYYAQVEMKKHKVAEHEPLAVLQWDSIIALNYPAKSAGVRRGMLAFEALEACSNIKFAHVATLVDKDGKDQLIDSSLMRVTRIRN